MAKARLSITVEKELLARARELAASQSQPLSRVIEAALEQILAAETQAEMVEGYRAMADFDRDLAEADMAAGYEVLPDG